jgi:hypothetical protein
MLFSGIVTNLKGEEMKFKDFLIDFAKWLLRLLIGAALLFLPLMLAVEFMEPRLLWLYIVSADADSVPDVDDDCEWSLWDYDWMDGAPTTNYRRVVVSWGVSDWHDHHLVSKG